MSPQLHGGILEVDVWGKAAAKKRAYLLESECLGSAARSLSARTWSKFVSLQCLDFPIWKTGITKVVQISCCDLGKALSVVSDT